MHDLKKSFSSKITPKKALNKKSLVYILKNLYVVVISGIKCEFAVQLSRGRDRSTNNKIIHAGSGSGAETPFKSDPEPKK